MKTPANKRSKDKYCRFHRDHGHDTEECHQLKEDIQELINRGFLRRFIAKDTEPQRGERRRSRSPPRRRGRSQERRRTRTPPRRESRQREGSPPQHLIFHTLVAGMVPGKESGESSDLHRHIGVKRARLGDVISFTDNDLPGYSISNDPLAFLGMGYKMEQLKPARVPLIGLDGEVLYADGMFQLLLTLGKGSRSAQVMLDILVVKVPSAHNMILGRLGLNALRAVPSTYHMEQLEPQEDSGREQGPKGGEVGISPPATVSFLLEGLEDPKTVEPVDEIVEVPLDSD
ncbi:uncharacterized protein LOC127802178 [Diospyros lotus]|uniref:uncharacterized protein LOC127802178 n=1 Tax=Diospyros lotus TaxID=55363 RepID=UPI002258CD9B|nr:uncharacterized protein LOC127802178 [Diospyros lotus]